MRRMHRMHCFRPARPASWPVGWIFAALLFSACSQPLQNGGVVMRQGAGDRVGMLCRWRHGDVSSEDFCGAPQAQVRPARVTRLAQDSPKLGGPLARGRAGDYLLENDEVIFVIGQIGAQDPSPDGSGPSGAQNPSPEGGGLPGAQDPLPQGGGLAGAQNPLPQGGGLAGAQNPLPDGGGLLADAADARLRVDEIESVVAFSASGTRAQYRDLKSGTGQDGSAWIEVSGIATGAAELIVTTRYTLGPADRAVVITTIVENRGTVPVNDVVLGDTVQWGSAEKIAPGMQAGFSGPSTGAWIGGIGRSVAYAFIPVDDKPITAESDAVSTRLRYAEGVVIVPGGGVRYDRVLAVAPRGDTLGILTELFFLQGGAPGGLEVSFADAHGHPLVAPEGRIWLGPPTDGTSPFLRVLGGAEQKMPQAAAEAPPGRYMLTFEGGGRQSVADVPITVTEGSVSHAKLVLSEPVVETAAH